MHGGEHAPGAPAPYVCPFPIPKNNFTRIHCDHVGPFPETNEGYKFCLTIVFAFSFFPELIPVRTQTAEETAADAVFELIFARYGIAETVYTDKGTAFSNAIMKALTKIVGANLYSSSSAHPQANSRAESINSNISKTLKTLIKDQKDWAKLLPAVCLSYRSTPTVAHGFTPAKVVYGFDPPLPINLTCEIQ
jgi:transposase InsO family protein